MIKVSKHIMRGRWNAGIGKIADKIIFFGFGALFLVTPLVMTPLNSELFEFNKMFFVYGLTVVIGASWVIREIYSRGDRGDRGDRGNKRYRIFLGFRVGKTPLDIPIFFFLASQIAATIFSIDPHVSVWGYYSRQNGGLLSTIAYIVLFYAFVSNIGGIGKDRENRREQRDKKNKSEAVCCVRNVALAKRLASLGVASGFLAAVYGIAQHFGIDKHLWVQDVQNRVFSTLGQPNWLAAHMAVLSFVALGMGIGRIVAIGRRDDLGDEGNRRSRRYGKHGKFSVFGDNFWIGLVTIFYLTILYTKSRSGLLAFWVGNGAFWSLVAIRQIGRIGGQIRRIFIGLNFALFILTFVVGVPMEKINKFMLPGWLHKIGESKIERIVIDRGNQGTVMARGGTESGKIRKYVWRGAWDAAKANPLFGTGVETFAWAFYRYKPVEHNLTSEWDFLYNKAHNEYLNYAATTGFVGLGSYLLVIVVFGVWTIGEIYYQRNNGHRGDSGDRGREELLVAGLFAAWVSILVTNFFGFSVVVTSLYFWMIPALVFACGERWEVGGGRFEGKKVGNSGILAGFFTKRAEFEKKIRTAKYERASRGFVVGGVIMAAGYLLVILGRYWYADVLYARGKRYLRGGYSLQANKALERAVRLRSAEPIFLDELGYLQGMLAVEAADRHEATRAAELVASALERQGRALKISPHNLNFIKTRVRLYYAWSEIFKDAEGGDRNGRENGGLKRRSFLELAVATLRLGRELAPNDPKILYNLALLQASQEDEKSAERAMATLRDAVRLKPDYRDARIALGMFYQQEGELEKAREQFEYVLNKINPEDEEAKGYLRNL